MIFPSEDFKKGYEAALAVVNAATINANHNDPAAAMRVARKMLMDGLNESEATLQRRSYYQADAEQQRQQVKASASAAGDNKFVKPSVQAEQLESVESINRRWVEEMSQGGPGPTGQILKAEV